MSQTKYITSGGLAFAEERDMEKLRRYSLKGWHVKSFAFMGYLLEKGQSDDYIYSVDYRTLKEEEREEYVDLLASSGWTLVSSNSDIHLFRALPGTKPIYSDRETVVEKHQHLGNPLKWIALSLLVLTAITWTGSSLSSGVPMISFAIAAISLSAITIPILWTVLTIFKNKWVVEEKYRLVTMTSAIVPLFLVGCLLFIFYSTNLNNPMGILFSMVAGAIIVPTTIWIIQSLLQNRKGKKA
ncbi:DUF2812 domain-containing protein [Shouchella lehensis]|uniref:DUF2812 domain-containing protein n=1 Tax=Shouchella lehensis TaxID=300825 RepID=A0A4Y7WKR8_9BACI|nr:DUF2812 domain-containing protein [Shouchella lehensis]MBG9783424.1 hypothetical protein [Shouchella lehensis]TES49185.1 DUF2812 domain-containing protein [Shouchella lehensis]